MMVKRMYVRDAMKKIWIGIAGLCILCLAAGCSIKKGSADKINDLEFTVVEKDKIPEELKTAIEEKKKNPFRLSYADKGYLYIAQGYGAKETSGYSIEVKECYEAKDAIYIHTNLAGPVKDDKVIEKTTYPYIAVKLEFIEKNVMFK